MFFCARQGGLNISETAIFMHKSVVFAKNGTKNRKHPGSSRSAGEKALLMREVSG